jgi:hypothetical protein
VAVKVDGGLDVSVAELLLDEVDRGPGGEPQGRGGVPQIMETDTRRQLGVRDRGDVPAAPHRMAGQRDRRTGVGEDPAGEGDLLSPVRTQHVKQVVGDRDSARLVALRGADPSDLHCLRHEDRSGVPVDVRPLESDRFAHAKPRAEQDLPHGPYHSGHAPK